MVDVFREVCPWCGLTRDLLTIEEGEPKRLRWRVWCMGCDVVGPEALTQTTAIASWNRRRGGVAAEFVRAYLETQTKRSDDAYTRTSGGCGKTECFVS